MLETPTLDAASFYNALSDVYDDLTGTDAREEGARRFVDRLIEGVSVQSGLDVACGTGVFTQALARRGVQTVGCDISADMLAVADTRGRSAGLGIAWECAPMQALPDSVAGPFDIVLCMGNSLPHLLDRAELGAALRGFAGRQPRAGMLALHLLNYSHVLATGERFVGAERRGNDEYIRFYDFERGLVRFNVLHLSWKADQAVHRFQTTTLFPYTHEDLVNALRESGYAQIELFGGLDFSEFDSLMSDCLLVTARKA